jgi:hypothetical protein
LSKIHFAGDCYEQAGKAFLALTKGCPDKRFLLVHGVVQYASGRVIEHAWIEDTVEGMVYDVASKAAYRADFFNQFVIKWRAHYQDRDLVLRLLEKTASWGPILWMEALGVNPSPKMGGGESS